MILRFLVLCMAAIMQLEPSAQAQFDARAESEQVAKEGLAWVSLTRPINERLNNYILVSDEALALFEAFDAGEAELKPTQKKLNAIRRSITDEAAAIIAQIEAIPPAPDDFVVLLGRTPPYVEQFARITYGFEEVQLTLVDGILAGVAGDAEAAEAAALYNYDRSIATIESFNIMLEIQEDAMLTKGHPQIYVMRSTRMANEAFISVMRMERDRFMYKDIASRAEHIQAARGLLRQMRQSISEGRQAQEAMLERVRQPGEQLGYSQAFIDTLFAILDTYPASFDLESDIATIMNDLVDTYEHETSDTLLDAAFDEATEAVANLEILRDEMTYERIAMMNQ